jgi:hypothetical protein
MAVWTLGLNHRTAPIDLRERFAFASEKLEQSLQGLRQSFATHKEVAILSTCNRTEIYCAGDAVHWPETLAWLAQTGQTQVDVLQSHTYRMEGDASARHAFRVASGLDSMVLGESQILGQLKDAVRLAANTGALGTTLNQAYSVVPYSTNQTLAAALRASLVVWNGGVGAFTLPSAAAVGANWFCMVRNNGSGILTLTPSGADTIDGNANQQLQLTESLVIVSNGATWNTFGYGRSNLFAYTALTLSVTGGTTTLTSAQASNTIQIYSGVLTSNQIIVVPSTVQLYTMTNNTTGSFTLTVKTAVGGGATLAIPQGTSLVVICDGTNVYNAASGSASTFATITLGNGSLSVPSLKFTGDLNSGLYLVSTGQVGLVVNNTQVGYYNASGLTLAGTGTFLTGVVGGAF